MNLETLGWTDHLASLFRPFLAHDLVPARVTRVDRGSVVVSGDFGTERAPLPSDRDAAEPAVGDWVAVCLRDGATTIHGTVPRRGVLSRRRPGAAEEPQAVAANVDFVLVVDGLDRGPNPRRIERAVALAWDAGATPVVVLSKADLCDDVEAAIATASAAAPFVEVIAISITHGRGLETLSNRLERGRTAVVLGPSGAGKSTLVNRLLGHDAIPTRPVRDGDAKGRHTTTHRELHVLPTGALLIDTPGIRELGLWLDSEAVDIAFPDIEALAPGCRFRDCGHDREPDCAVRAAEENGEMAPGRRAAYLRLQAEVEASERRRDPSKRHEMRARDRVFARLVRAEVRRKGGK